MVPSPPKHRLPPTPPAKPRKDSAAAPPNSPTVEISRTESVPQESPKKEPLPMLTIPGELLKNDQGKKREAPPNRIMSVDLEQIMKSLDDILETKEEDINDAEFDELVVALKKLSSV